MSIKNLELNDFLLKNNIKEEDLKNSKVDWETLKKIGIDHESRLEERKETAELFAKVIQRCDKVHSVRWRVKDPQHLMEKIFRKTIEGSDTYNKIYLEINADNYHEIVTDLVGVRALHLFKDDCFGIDEYLRNLWKTKERPVYYVRSGDDETTDLERFEVKQHPAGYRSIHYVFESTPLKQKIYTEVQVRTIFEEGWSEIDHKVRYPNFSDNEQVSYFLRIFNRLAGSADEMGTFVKELVTELKATASQLTDIANENAKIKEENEKNIAKIDGLFCKLEALNGKNRSQNTLVSQLKAEVDKLKSQSHKEVFTSGQKTIFSKTMDVVNMINATSQNVTAFDNSTKINHKKNNQILISNVNYIDKTK
ncbi:addiction module component [Shewanella algae]|uniref:RelA/SpoT domain-containing protein n=1 Tax=Shewanella algae TaxID=38313 RepID=UPI0022317A19|nr:addiction module component [Shewanella algae]UZD56847.1 addiction module component [Shewanella algae]